MGMLNWPVVSPWRPNRTSPSIPVKRDRALFESAISINLKGCDLMRIKIGTLVKGHEIRTYTMFAFQQDQYSCPVRDHDQSEGVPALVA
jgi:hypothetical protein